MSVTSRANDWWTEMSVLAGRVGDFGGCEALGLQRVVGAEIGTNWSRWNGRGAVFVPRPIEDS